MKNYNQLPLPIVVFVGGGFRSEQVHWRLQADLPQQQSRKDFIAELGRCARSGQRVEIPVRSTPNTTWLAYAVGRTETGRYLWDLYLCGLPHSKAA